MVKVLIIGRSTSTPTIIRNMTHSRTHQTNCSPNHTLPPGMLNGFHVCLLSTILIAILSAGCETVTKPKKFSTVCDTDFTIDCHKRAAWGPGNETRFDTSVTIKCGTTKVAGEQVQVTFPDKTSKIGTTDANGEVTFSHKMSGNQTAEDVEYMIVKNDGKEVKKTCR